MAASARRSSRTALRTAKSRASILVTLPTALSRVQLTEASDTAPATSWIQLAVTGPIETRKIEITSTDLQRMEENFRTGKFPVPPTEICVDYDHFSINPENAGDGRAAGWIKRVELRENDTELWGLVEWTPAGAEAVANKEYRFVSPVINWNFTTNDGEKIGCTLINAALTNVPQLQGMEPTELRHAGTLRPVGVGRVVPLAMSDRDRFDRVAEAVCERFGRDDFGERDWDCYALDLFGGEVLFRKGGRYWTIGFAFGEDGAVTLAAGDPTEVTLQPVPVGAAMRTGTMPLLKLKAANGQVVEVEQEQVEQTEAYQALRAKVPAEGQVVLSQTDYSALTTRMDQLAGQVTELSAANARTADELLTRDCNDAVGQLVRDRKILPAQADTYKALYRKDKALFDQLAATATVVGPAVERVHGSADATAAVSENAFDAKVRELRAQHPTLSEADAILRAGRENPDLYREYASTVAVKI